MASRTGETRQRIAGFLKDCEVLLLRAAAAACAVDRHLAAAEMAGTLVAAAHGASTAHAHTTSDAHDLPTSKGRSAYRRRYECCRSLRELGIGRQCRMASTLCGIRPCPCHSTLYVPNVLRCRSLRRTSTNRPCRTCRRYRTGDPREQSIFWRKEHFTISIRG